MSGTVDDDVNQAEISFALSSLETSSEYVAIAVEDPGRFDSILVLTLFNGSSPSTNRTTALDDASVKAIAVASPPPLPAPVIKTTLPFALSSGFAGKNVA